MVDGRTRGEQWLCWLFNFGTVNSGGHREIVTHCLTMGLLSFKFPRCVFDNDNGGH